MLAANCWLDWNNRTGYTKYATMKTFLSLGALLVSLPAPLFGFSSIGQPACSRTQTQLQVSSRVDFVKTCLSSLAFTTLLPQETNADVDESSSALETALSAREGKTNQMPPCNPCCLKRDHLRSTPKSRESCSLESSKEG